MTSNETTSSFEVKTVCIHTSQKRLNLISKHSYILHYTCLVSNV